MLGIRISMLLFVMILSFCYGVSTVSEQCLSDTIDFETKIDKSSIVVYGKLIAKEFYSKSKTMFHVFFQVDCILKGPATLKQINITNAGRIEGKQNCQKLLVGDGSRYSIVFLEPTSSNESDYFTYTPADFTEMSMQEDSANLLLSRTCNLQQTVPRDSSASPIELCPSVSTDPICQTVVDTSMTTIPMGTANDILSDVIIKSSDETPSMTNSDESMSLHSANLPEKEINFFQTKSLTTQIDVDQRNNGKATTINFFCMLMSLCILFLFC